MSKHLITIRGLCVVTTCWSWACSNHTSPSKWVGLGSPLAASSVYGDLNCSVHTVNNLCMFNCQSHFYLCNRGSYVRLAFVPNMLSSWNKDIIIIIIISCDEKIISYDAKQIRNNWVVLTFPSIKQWPQKVGWLCWGLTSQSTIFQSCRDGAIASWVINQYFRGVKCLAQGHNTAAVGLEPPQKVMEL